MSKREWDQTFSRWIAAGEAEGLDPNDVGDRKWDDPREHIERVYMPHIRQDSVVLELGPGTGRISRHIVGRCGEMILADYSSLACGWLDRYLAGKGRFRTVCLDRPVLEGVEEGSVDFAFAFGVFEHIDLDDTRWYLEEFHRVLKPGGQVIFNFDNLMTREGLEWHARWRREPGHRNIFRFYHPEMISWLAQNSGFEVRALRTGDSRHAEIELLRR